MSSEQPLPSVDATSQLRVNTAENLKHYHSDSALNISLSKCSEEDLSNVTKRTKRTFDGLPGSSFSNIIDMFDELSKQREQDFKLLNDSLTTIITQNTDIKASVANVTAQHQEMLLKIINLEKSNSDYQTRVATLERQVDYLEKKAYGTTIEIRNLPKKDSETKECLTAIVQELELKLGLHCPIQEFEIKDIFRTKSDSLVVDFTTTLRKESVISNSKKFNKSKRANKQPLLNTGHLNLPGESRPVYISDYLTPKASRLFYLARQSVKNNKLSAAWTSYGKIYIKQEDGSKPVRINDEAELDKLSI